MFSAGKKESAVNVVQYDEKVKRRSLEDPLRQHRRSSIPFVDRKPAVRFIRSIDQRQASVTGPNVPRASTDDGSKKPILKKSSFPILITQRDENFGGAGGGSTNDDLDNCKLKAELIMEKISRAERIARGSMDVLTFPTATRRVEALSRYHGSVTISVCTIDILTGSSEYGEEKKKSNQIVLELQSVVEMAQQMLSQATTFQTTAKQFLSRAKRRYTDWEGLLKRNSDFKVDHSKLNYPIYTHKRMPESVTLYEDAMEDPQSGFDGYVRVCRKYPEEMITLHCDSSEQADQFESINFQNSPLETQAEVVKFITAQGKNLLVYSDNCLNQGLEVILDQEIDEAFEIIQNKLNSLEYDDTFDPLCALELKTSLGELVARKADLLNTAEQIVQHCKQIVSVSKLFCRFAKRSVKGGGAGCACCIGGSSKKKLLRLLGMVSVDDVTILLPLTLAVAQDIFHMDPFTYSGENNEARVENPE